MNPYRGYVVSEEEMIRDIEIMKRLNINTCARATTPTIRAGTTSATATAFT